MKSDFFERHTRPAIERNTAVRIYWNKYLGQSLDSYIKECHEKGFPEGKVYALIAKEHKKELDSSERLDWAELLKSNIGSTYSRLNSKEIPIIDTKDTTKAIAKIDELMNQMPKTEGEYLYNLKLIKELLE